MKRFDKNYIQEAFSKGLSGFVGKKNDSKTRDNISVLLKEQFNNLGWGEYFLNVEQDLIDPNKINIKVDIPDAFRKGYFIVTREAAKYLDKIGKAAITDEIVECDLLENILVHVDDGWITDLSSLEMTDFYFLARTPEKTWWKNPSKNIRFKIDEVDGEYAIGFAYDSDKRYSRQMSLRELSIGYVFQED